MRGALNLQPRTKTQLRVKCTTHLHHTRLCYIKTNTLSAYVFNERKHVYFNTAKKRYS